MNRKEGTILKKHMSLSRIIMLLTVVFMLCSAAALANSFAETYGFSAKGIAMGNAMTASVNDWSSVYYNMAGLGKTSHLKFKHIPEDGTEETEELLAHEISLNVMYTNPQFNLGGIKRYDADGKLANTPAAKDLEFTTIVLGLTVDLNKILKAPDIVSSSRWGLAMAIPGAGYAARVNDLDARTHNFLRYGREAEHMVITTGFGWGILEDMLGFGIGMTANFGGKANAQASEVVIGPDEQTPFLQTKMDLQIVPSLVTGGYLSLKRIGGTHIDIDGGLTYRQENYMEVYPFMMDQIVKAGGVNILVRTSIFDYYIPHVITGGLSVKYRGLTVTGQLDIELWSRFHVSRTMRDFFAQLNKSATVPSLYDLPKFNNIVTERIGISYKLFDWLDVMGGYYFQPTFVPNGSIRRLFNMLDNNRHVVSFGARIGLPRLAILGGPADFVLGCQFQILEDRKVNKTDEAKSDLNPNYSFGGWNPTIMAEFSMKL
jgi:hypothetical protein